ncbi:uncharacterized protein LOC125220962 [Salvia hispanica]|uniref:uncharacterized protein LOC125220962 n=1 Tax=Salvia hispanica TaxID=49212 RepID=UPI0020092BE1|nr:uncharacterized protein LOC125220962 [Salvia hispanica]
MPEMASFSEDDLMPKGPEESFICKGARGFTKGCGVRIQCASSALCNNERGLARFWFKHYIVNVMYACIILHNIIINDEGPGVVDWSDDEAGPSTGRATPPVSRGLPYEVIERLRERGEHAQATSHRALMSDMIEEVWARRSR